MALSIDHKPSNLHKANKIMAAGGKIYQSSVQKPSHKSNQIEGKSLAGPHRVLPHILSVSRHLEILKLN